MKKLTFMMAFMIIAITSFAQNMQVQTAYNHLKKSKLKEALTAIQPALEHPQTSTQPKTWYYYGNICYEIANSTNQEYKNLLSNPIDEAVRGYTKAAELDKRDEYSEDINRMMTGISAMYSDKGIVAYEAKDFQSAAGYFSKAYEVRENLGRVDTSMLKYAGNCWIAAANWDNAYAVFTKLQKMNYEAPDVYVALAKIAVEKKDLKKAVEYLDEGEAKFPTNLIMLTEKANMYMVGELSDLDKGAAVKTLKKLIDVEPNNVSIWNSLGTCYATDTTKFEEAVNAFLKCMELKQDFINAYYGLSNLYLDKANSYIKIANELPIDAQEEYQRLTDLAENTFKEVLPYIEKAHELDSADKGVKQILKEIYIRLKMLDKAKELN